MIKKRILSILLILCIMLTTRSVPVMAVALTGNFTVVGGSYGADYSYANNVLTISTNTPLTISGTTTTDKIVVNATSAQVTLSGVNIQLSSSGCAFDIQGNSVVNLTLTGTNTLKSGNGVAGLQVQTKDGKTASVTIGGDGSLNATGGNYSAGIGGGTGGAGGEITIGGGTINATGNGSGAGYSGAGIGGGSDGGGGIITITGGVITATGAENAAGIGGGASPIGLIGIGTIEISGGTVIATGGSWSGAGIGSGYKGTGGTITISGTSNVTAIGGGSGAGIGGGASGAAGTIKISNTAKVTAVSIGTKSAIDDDDGNITPGSDTVTNILMGNFKSSVTSGVKTEVKDSSGNSLSSEISYTPNIAYKSIAFTVPIDSYTLYTNGVKQDGTKAGTTSTVFAVTTGLNTFANVEGSKVPTILNVSTPGILPTGVTHASNVFTIGIGANNTTINVSGTTTIHTIVVANGVTNLTLILNDVSITSYTKSPIDLQGTANVTIQLADGTTNLLDASNAGVGVGTAGICTNGTATITISGNTGSLTAKGGHSGAGIGGGKYSTGGNITISGGTVAATGGHSGAGIGGTNGTVLGGTNGTGGNITISGGTVTATGGNSAAGIGGGYYGEGGIINISGGTVTATGGTQGAGIGGGTNGAGGTITISSGTVTATGGTNGAGIGGGYGRPGGAITIGDNAVVMAVSSSKPAIEAVSGSSGNVINARFISAITNDDTYLKCNANVLRFPAYYQGFAFSATAPSSVALYSDQACTTKLYDIVTDPGGATAIPVSTNIINIPTPVKTAVAPTYTMTASALTAFSSQKAGYASAPAAQTVTITNTGNQTITLTQPTSTNYNIGELSTTSLGVGGTATFTVQPKTGLGVGAYNETISISGTNGATVSVNAVFSVTAPTSFDVNVTGSLPTGVTHASNVFTIGTGANNTTINVTGITNTNTIVVATGVTNLTLILNGVSIQSTTRSPIDLKGTANVTIQLADGTTNTLDASAASVESGTPGICTNGMATITISGNTGSIIAKGGNNGAGIGGNNGMDIGGTKGAGGNITISGGTVTATGGTNAAGLGGGYYGAGGNITISGGTVTATGGTDGAGIGCGAYGEGGNITIDVNSVVMAASKSDYAIYAASGSGNVINANFSSAISTTNDTYLQCNSNVLRLPASYTNFAFSATVATFVILYSDQSCTTKLYDIVADPSGATSIPISTNIYDNPTLVKTAAPTYTVTYNGNGSTSGSVTAQSTNVGTATTVAANGFTKTDYTFAGWNIAANGSGTAYAAGGTVPSQTEGTTVTLYAQWISDTPAQTYTVTFDSKGGSEVASLINVAPGATIAPPTAPSKPNYIFGSWYSDQEYIVAWNFDLDSVLGNMTLYAKWTPDSPTPPAPPTPSTPSSNTSNVEKNIGQIIKDQQLDKSVPNTNMNNNTEDLKSSVFTTEELEKIGAGEDAKVILKVTDINNSVSEDDKKLITKKLDQGNSVMYIDLSLYKKVGNGAETKITETKNKISISIEVPVELRSTDMEKNRTYKIVRIHDGVVTIIEGTYDPVTYLFTFETDRFSTYALAYEDTNDTTDSGEKDNAVTDDFFHLRLTAKAAETSQKLTYTKIPRADGYNIYGSLCGSNNKMVKLADVSGKTTSYSHKDLKKATYYKYYVQAYKIIDGKKVVIATSRVIHSNTTSKTYANPTKVVSDTSTVILAVGTSKKVTCKDVVPDSKKVDYHTSVIRYETTNKELATVTQSGKIKAMSKGTCYIYAYAQNGVYKKIKVIVK